MKHPAETIARIMQERGCNRKSAVQYLRRQAKRVSIDIETLPGPALVAVQNGKIIHTTQYGKGEPLPVAPVSAAFPDDEPGFANQGTISGRITEPASDTITEMVHVLKEIEPFVQGVAATQKTWDPARAVELFKGGMKVIDIAVEMGYVRGQGCNRTRAALAKAGVL